LALAWTDSRGVFGSPEASADFARASSIIFSKRAIRSSASSRWIGIAGKADLNYARGGDEFQHPDGHALNHQWRDAAGSLIGNTQLVRPFTNARAPGAYQFVLTVDDLHGGQSTDRVTVTVQAESTGGTNPSGPVAWTATINVTANNTLVYRSSSSPSLPARLDTSFLSADSEIRNARRRILLACMRALKEENGRGSCHAQGWARTRSQRPEECGRARRQLSAPGSVTKGAGGHPGLDGKAVSAAPRQTGRPAPHRPADARQRQVFQSG
jgi:hypothetical protein